MLRACNTPVGRPAMRRVSRIALAAAVVSASSSALASDAPEYSKLPKYVTPVPYAGIRNYHVTQNLGPTGARGWVYGHTNNTREAREIMIKSVEPGSPAEGILRPYDFIVGVALPVDGAEGRPEPKPFDSDARLALAKAVTFAESKRAGGRLKLLRSRDGEVEPVTITIPVMGDYAPSAPFDCPKTELIVKNAAEFLGERTPAQGFGGMTGALNAMFLYATGDDRYLDHVRRSACRMSINHKVNDAGHETWRWGYCNTFLCEYYLATGDGRVLPTIEEYCDVLAKGQCNPGTWGHRAVPDRIPPGYGSMNQSGLVCFLSLVLARQCGVEVDDEAVCNCIGFYGGYAGRGGMPYGDHPPYPNATSNGKNGSAAVAFSILGAGPAAQWFARLCASANLAAFEGGHTGNFFNQTWSPLGAALAGRENYQGFWMRFNSYRDLARRWDGSFVTQPLPNTREGDLGTGNYVNKGPMWTTGGYALSYLATNGRLSVLGRRRSVFGRPPPDELKGALGLYREKRFEECATEAARLRESDDRVVSVLAGQLETAARRNAASIKLTLDDIKKNLDKGDLFKLKWQLQAIESVVDAGDERLKPFRSAVDDPANEEIIKTGERYHRIVSGFGRCGVTGFIMYLPSSQTNSRWHGELKGIAERGAGAYREMARAYLESHPAARLEPDTPLVPPSGANEDTKPWRALEAGANAPEGWKRAGFDDEAWTPVAMRFKAAVDKRNAGPRLLRARFDVADPASVECLSIKYVVDGSMKVHLNGELIFDITGTSESWWGRGVTIPLKPCTVELLREGENVLAVEASPGKGGVDVDVVLKAMMRE